MSHKTCIVLVVLSLLFSSIVRADDDQDKTIAELKARVATLEKRVETLEKLLAPLQADAQRKALREQFERRVDQDEKKYSSSQLFEAENLYQTMNKQWRSPEGREALEQLVKKYPDINRTGCAELYLGQVSEGVEKVQHLQTAIEKHGDCMYGDGVQVGAYARYLLALCYKEKGDDARANSLFDEIRKDFPYAVDHEGKSLEEQIPRE
jgi:tetratricopeptide (TPR) repeat protein